jgi:hypothetical protein
VVANHPFYVQGFDGKACDVAIVHKFGRLLVNKIVTAVADFFVDQGNLALLPSPVCRAFLFTAQAALFNSQLFQTTL